MDFKNFETTSTYAIEAVYNAYYNLIPDVCRVKDPLMQEHEATRGVKPTQKHPMTQEEVKKVGFQSDTEYFNPDTNPDDIDLTPFYDPELNFSDRFHYRLTNIDYPKRYNPWYIITWNFGNGILKSSLTNRRLDTNTITNDEGDMFKFQFQNVDLDLTLAFTSNSMQALWELQENIIIGRRLKSTVQTKPHYILGKFLVSIDTMDSDITKYSKDKGTLCCLMLKLKVSYPIIGNVQKISKGVIMEIHTEIDKLGTGPENQFVYAREVINDGTFVKEDALDFNTDVQLRNVEE